MIGINELRLNEATVCAALQMYLNEPILDANDYVEVTSVREINTPNKGFVTIVKAKEPKVNG